MMSASAMLSSPASGVFVSRTFDFVSTGLNATLTTSAAPAPASSAGNAFGRVVAIAGVAVTSRFAKTLPE